MRSIYFHLVGGGSGDMLLSALIDLGCPLSHLKKEFRKLDLNFKIITRKVKKEHFAVKKIFFEGKPLRTYSAIKSIISASRLEREIKKSILGTYQVIFEVERKIHQAGKLNLHLHHLGEIDAVLEISGFFIASKYLNVEKVYSSVFPLSMPAPATLALLKGKTITAANLAYESVTPTAAVLLRGAEQIERPINFARYGLGWGGCDKNDYLVVYLFDDNFIPDRIIKIETNIDDMNPQGFEPLFEALYRQGAKEVYLEQVMMKKTRPAFVLNVLCAQENFKKLRDLIFSHTSTFGVRYREYARDKLRSKLIEKKTSLGKVRFRVSQAPFKKEAPEYGDCLAISKNLKIPLREVYRRLKCF